MYVIKMLLKVFGWQKLLLMVWRVIDVELNTLVKKTATKLDDEALAVLEEVVTGITSYKE